MIRIKDYILNENEIVKIQFDDGSKEMEIDHKNGNRTFIDGTFDDIEWNYDKNNNIHEEYVISQLKDYENKIKDLEEELNELKSDYSLVVTENKKLKFSMQDTYDSANDTCGELQQRINKTIKYVEQIDDWDIKDFRRKELLKILKGEENGE